MSLKEVPSHLTTEERLALRHGAERLVAEFDGKHDRQTVEEYIHSSYVHLASSARIPNFIPLLAERFARQRLQALAKVQDQHDAGVPTVIFIDEHNAGRSQMAMALLHSIAGDDVASWSGGHDPAPAIFDVVKDVMDEVGISLADEYPKHWTPEVLQAADLIVTMGHQLSPDEAGQTPVRVWDVRPPYQAGHDSVRAIREDLRQRVQSLVADGVTAVADATAAAGNAEAGAA